MNAALLPYLASPVTRRSLALARDTLRTTDGSEEFALIEGVPILLPPGQVADWYLETLEVVFGQQASDVMAEADAAETSDGRADAIRAALVRLGKEGVRERFRAYARQPLQERLGTYVRLPASRQAAGFPTVSQAALEAVRQAGSLEGGQERASQAMASEESWALHLEAYGAAVLEGRPGTIVELGTGAGLGTWAVLRRGLGSGLMVSLDVDLACAGSAMGLAKALGLQDQVIPVVASFWFLPFRDGSIATVCAHYGLDESREVPRVLGEASRVLVRGGRLVTVSRVHPADRLDVVLGSLGFGKDELSEMATEAQLCAGPEQISKAATSVGLHLESQELYQDMPGHARVQLVFRRG